MDITFIVTMDKGPSELKKEYLEVIAAMNDVYFGRKGRAGGGSSGGTAGVGGWSGAQARFAADYFLKLLEGSYIDLPSQLEQRIKADTPLDLMVHQALISFTDFTQGGVCFLYHTEPNISQDVMRTIALKLIEKIERANFTDRACAKTAITILAGFESEKVLPSARNTWLEDYYSPPRVPYDADITNRFLIPEAIQYARRNIPINR